MMLVVVLMVDLLLHGTVSKNLSRYPNIRNFNAFLIGCSQIATKPYFAVFLLAVNVESFQ